MEEWILKNPTPKRLLDAMERLTLEGGLYNVILTPKLNSSGDQIAARATFAKTSVWWFYRHGSIWHSFLGPEMERIRKAQAKTVIAALASDYPTEIRLQERHGTEFRWRR